METQTILGTEMTALFASQQHTALRIKKASAAERIARIIKLKDVLTDNFDLMLKAEYDDYKKPAEEAKLTLGPIFDEIDVAVAFLET